MSAVGPVTLDLKVSSTDAQMEELQLSIASVVDALDRLGPLRAVIGAAFADFFESEAPGHLAFAMTADAVATVDVDQTLKDDVLTIGVVVRPTARYRELVAAIAWQGKIDVIEGPYRWPVLAVPE